MTDYDQLQQAIAALEGQRSLLGDVVVDAAVTALQREWATRQETVASQRRQVTVLLADVSGFTALSEQMDAEDVAEMMHVLWQQVDGVIVDCGGEVDKHLGDAVVAFWGREQSQEDDVEQAVRAALAIRQVVAGFIVPGLTDVVLPMRVGVHTGSVVWGQVGRVGEYSAVGATIDEVTRLCNMTPSDGVLISQDAYTHVRGIFDVQQYDRMMAVDDGPDRQTYLVERAKARSFHMPARGLEGIETRMVGREQELRQLQMAFEAAVQERRTTLITIVGEAGMGKSRLLHEFDKWVELLPQFVRLFRGRAQPSSEAMPLSLVRDVFAFRFQIQDSDSTEVVWRKMVAGVSQFVPDEAEMKAHLLGAWLGYDFSASPHVLAVGDDVRQWHHRARCYMVELFTAVAQSQPTVILLEDVHWADKVSLETIAALPDRFPELPLLVVCLTRPSLWQRFPDWSAAQISIMPLTAAVARLLVAEILRKVEMIPSLLYDLIIDRAEGNPFFIEEFIKMFIDVGAIVPAAARWYVRPERLIQQRIPTTLTGILQTRLDQLSAWEKEVLQRAAVVGRIFWDMAVGSEEAVQAALVALQEKELIFGRSDSTIEGAKAYIFKHVLLRDMVYESILKQTRQVYHCQTAAWLLSVGQQSQQTVTYAALMAEHYEKGGDLVQAGHWYGRAGQQAANQVAYEEALHWLNHAMDLIPITDVAGRYALLKVRERVYSWQGEREAQQRDLSTLDELVKQLSAAERGYVALRQAEYAEALGRYARVTAILKDAAKEATLADDRTLLARVHYLWGHALRMQGEIMAARWRFEQAWYEAEAVGAGRVLVDSLRGLGGIARYEGNYTEAKGFYQRSLTASQRIGYQHGEEMTLAHLGLIAMSFGAYEQAQRYYEEGLMMTREIGNVRGQGYFLRHLGCVSDSLEQYSQAQTYFEQALEIFQQVEDRVGEAGCLSRLGQVACALQNWVAAQLFFREALSIRQELKLWYAAAEDRSGLAQIAMAQSDAAEALSQVEAVLKHWRQNRLGVGMERPFWVYRVCYEVLRWMGDVRADIVLTQAYTLLQERASKIPDETDRYHFLQQVQDHHYVMQAWQVR